LGIDLDLSDVFGVNKDCTLILEPPGAKFFTLGGVQVSGERGMSIDVNPLIAIQRADGTSTGSSARVIDVSKVAPDVYSFCFSRR
jgi:hypothetical protein